MIVRVPVLDGHLEVAAAVCTRPCPVDQAIAVIPAFRGSGCLRVAPVGRTLTG